MMPKGFETAEMSLLVTAYVCILIRDRGAGYFGTPVYNDLVGVRGLIAIASEALAINGN